MAPPFHGGAHAAGHARSSFLANVGLPNLAVRKRELSAFAPAI
jgi:hypothetical protein